jgi:hypothetical protein
LHNEEILNLHLSLHVIRTTKRGGLNVCVTCSTRGTYEDCSRNLILKLLRRNSFLEPYSVDASTIFKKIKKGKAIAVTGRGG